MEGEQLNFFEMLEVEDKKEKHLKAKNKPVEKQKEKTDKLSDNAKNTTQAKKKTKAKDVKPKVESKPKEVKILTLDEQIEEVEKSKNKSLNLILKYLLTLDCMKEKMAIKEKSLKKCWEFIKGQAQEKAINGCAAVEDKEVYGWAVHYYEETNEQLKTTK